MSLPALALCTSAAATTAIAEWVQTAATKEHTCCNTMVQVPQGPPLVLHSFHTSLALTHYWVQGCTCHGKDPFAGKCSAPLPPPLRYITGHKVAMVGQCRDAPALTGTLGERKGAILGSL